MIYTIEAYEEAHSQVVTLTADVRRLTKVAEENRTTILDKMGKFFLAKCQQYIIVRNSGRILTPTITLANANIIPLSDVASITLKNGKKIPGDQILKLYSGRNEGDKIAVSK